MGTGGALGALGALLLWGRRGGEMRGREGPKLRGRKGLRGG